MPNINLTDSRSRDAVVKAETTGVDEEVRYVDDEGRAAYTRKILKATVKHDFETLVKDHDGDAEALGKALIDSDPEVNMEICGLYLWGVSKVYVDSSDGVVYRIEQQEIVRDPDGSVREKRPRSRPEANVDSEIPLTWTDKKIDKNEAVRRFVFASKLQIVHVNGLTYDFLYGMAKELAESNSLMMLGAGGKGRDPLIFRHGSVPYRGFLEGRIDGEKYLLLLHLSNLELKSPTESKPEEVAEEKSADSKKKSKKSAAKVSKKKSATAKTKENTVTETDTPEKVAEEAKDKTEKSTKAKKAPAKKKSAAKKSATRKIEKTADKPKDSVSTDKKSVSDINQNPAESQAVTTSEDLGVWLKSVRMGKYLQLFIDNEIDVDVLTELTDDDLKELEIPVGSRRRLLKAVEETDNLHAEVALAVNRMAGGGETTKKPTGKSKTKSASKSANKSASKSVGKSAKQKK